MVSKIDMINEETAMIDLCSLAVLIGRRRSTAVYHRKAGVDVEDPGMRSSVFR